MVRRLFRISLPDRFRSRNNPEVDLAGPLAFGARHNPRGCLVEIQLRQAKLVATLETLVDALPLAFLDRLWCMRLHLCSGTKHTSQSLRPGEFDLALWCFCKGVYRAPLAVEMPKSHLPRCHREMAEAVDLPPIRASLRGIA